MLFKVEQILIPENYVRILMTTVELNEFLFKNFDEDTTIFEYKKARYLFYDDGFVIEEQIV